MDRITGCQLLETEGETLAMPFSNNCIERLEKEMENLDHNVSD